VSDNDVLLSGILLTDPVTEETDEGVAATFTMTGGRLAYNSSNEAEQHQTSITQESLDQAYRNLEAARASGHTYSVVVPDVAGEFTLFYLQRGRSVTVLGAVDATTQKVTDVRLVNSTLFLAFLDDDGWHAIPTQEPSTLDA